MKIRLIGEVAIAEARILSEWLISFALRYSIKSLDVYVYFATMIRTTVLSKADI